MATATAKKKTTNAKPKAKANGNPIAKKLRDIISELKSETVEREVEADLLVRAILAGQNALLIGEPGVAKSLLIDLLVERMEASIFTLLMAKDTPSEQVLGPVSLAALERDEFQRITTGKLPESNIGWIDEIFKANSTVLNAMLKIINEGKFDNNGHSINLDFWSMIGASNELPGPDRSDLNAFRDRFAVTRLVQHVRTSAGLVDVIDGQLARYAGQSVAPNVTVVTSAEIKQAQEAVTKVGVPDQVKKNMIELRQRAEGENLRISVRRMFGGLAMMMAGAYLTDRPEVGTEDLKIFEHVLWSDPDDHNTAYELTLDYAGAVAKKASKLRGEYEEQQRALNDLQKEMPTDGSVPESELMGNIGRTSNMLKKLDERVSTAIEDAQEEGHETGDLDQLQANISAARESVKKLLGIGS